MALLTTKQPDSADAPPLVIVIDDDSLVRGSMDSLFRSVELETLCFASAAEVLDITLPDRVCCMVVDIRMPLLGGLEFQSRLTERGIGVPIIFVTGHGDIPMSVRAMKAGAADFLPKPFRDQDMLDAVSAAHDRDRLRRRAEAENTGHRDRYATLTPREREVMAGVTRGLLNKQVGGELGITEITVKLHRSSLMRKMGVRTLPDLVRIAEALSGKDGSRS